MKIKDFVVYDGKVYDWEEVVHYMDDDLREALHYDMAPCTNEEFLAAYLEKNEDGEDWLKEIGACPIPTRYLEKDALEALMQTQTSWDDESIERLLDLAMQEDGQNWPGMYEDARAEDFESVIFKAADVLGIEIV